MENFCVLDGLIIKQNTIDEKDWALYMMICPKNKLFATSKDMKENMEKRMEFVQTLDKIGDSSGIFKVTDSFVSDFIVRND